MFSADPVRKCQPGTLALNCSAYSFSVSGVSYFGSNVTVSNVRSFPIRSAKRFRTASKLVIIRGQ